MSILQIRDLIHQYITYGEKEEENQTVNAVDGVDLTVERVNSLRSLDTMDQGNRPWRSTSTDCFSPHPVPYI